MGDALAIGVAVVVGGFTLTALMLSWVAAWVVFVPLLLIVVALMLMSRRRSGAPPFFRDVVNARLAPELVLLPIVVSVKPGSRLQLGVLALLVLSAFVRQKRGASERSNYATMPALLLVLCIILSYYDEPRVAVEFIAVAAILWFMSFVTCPASANESLLAGMSLYLVVNIAGWLAGFKAPGADIRIGGYETSSALFSQRVLFPFSTSINASACIGAALIVAVAAMVRIRRRPQWYHLIGVAAAVFIIVGSNARGPLILAGVVAVVLLVFPRASRSAGPWIAVAALPLPLVIQSVPASFMEWLAGLLAGNEYLARGGSAKDILAFGGRDRIWSSAIQFWNDHVNSFQHQLIGYGAPGQVKSGAYGFFPADISHFLNDRSILTTHNSILQSMLETGLVGAVILLAVVFVTVRRYGRTSFPIFAVALVVGLSGVIEVSLTAGSGHTPFFVLLYLAFFLSRGKNAAKARRAVDTNEPAATRAHYVVEPTHAATNST